MSVDDEKDKITNKDLLEHLATQYKLYREEIRIYLGFAATSTTLLLFLLFGELTAAKGKEGGWDTKLFILIPISLVWYGAVLALFMSHVSVIEKRSDLIEFKMDCILKQNIFRFGHNYKFPSWTFRDVLPSIVFGLFAGGIPFALAFFAGRHGILQHCKELAELLGSTCKEGQEYFWESWFVIIYLTCIFFEASLVFMIRTSRSRLNNEIKRKWAADFKCEYMLEEASKVNTEAAPIIETKKN